jgi:hypothetical protein
MLRRAIEGRTDHVDKLFAHLSDAEARAVRGEVITDTIEVSLIAPHVASTGRSIGVSGGAATHVASDASGCREAPAQSE